MKKVVNFLVFFSLLMLAETSAQNPYIHHYSTRDGLPSNTIYQMCQDSRKFIWLTSDAGVIKFDGSNFTNYRKKDGLSSNDVVRIKEDPMGRIWFFNYNATANYYYNDKIYNEQNAPFLKDLKGKGFIMDFYVDGTRALYFYNYQREVFSLDTNNIVSRKVLFNEKINQPIGAEFIDRVRVSHIDKNNKGEWVIWANCGILGLNELKGKFKWIDSLWIEGVFPAPHSTYYVNTYHSKGIYKVNNDYSKEQIHFAEDVSKIKTILEDSEGYVWIAAYDEGVYCLKNKEIVLRLDFNYALGLLQDHEGNIWVSTQSDGVYIINRDILSTTHYGTEYFDNAGLNRLTPEPRLGIWCSGIENAYLLREDRLYKMNIPESIKPLNLSYVFKDGGILLGSKGLKIGIFDNFRINSSSGSITPHKPDLINVAIKKIVDNRAGDKSAIFDQVRILFFDPVESKHEYNFDYVDQRINNAFFNARDEFIVNSKRNYRYNKGRLELYPALSCFDGALITDHIILDDTTELFNIDGDSLYLLFDQKFFNLTKAFETPITQQVKKILYEESTLFLATNIDIFICKNPLTIIQGNSVQLLPLNISFDNINDILLFNDSLYIASREGLTIIPKHSMLGRSSILPVPYLKSVTVNDRLYSLPLHELKLIGKNTINLSFGYISYFSTSVIYSYMLEGSDKEWIIGTGNQISLIYKDLPRGNYVFKLRVRKSNSGWSEPLEMAIRIRPTLVEYPLFWAAVTLVVAGIAFLISYRIRKQKMKQLEMDHELVMTQQKALQSMMNPHFVFNSLGSIQNYLLKNKGAEAVMYLTEFSRLIRQNLSSINMPMIPLNEELDRLKNYLELENKRLEKIFDYEIAVEKVLQTQQVFIPSMLIQPFAENAIWHGIATLQKDGMIRLKIEKHTSATLKITIEDNGIGITESRRNQGQGVQHLRMGMDMTMKRLDLLSRRYKTEASVTTADCNPGMPNPGTRVELVMPFLLSV